MALEFRRGRAAIQESATSGGRRRPFEPRIDFPAEDEGKSKYVLVLSDIEDVYRVQYHEWVPAGTFETKDGETKQKWAQFICRKEPAINDDCRLCDELEHQPRLKSIGVGVELEPVVESDNGRKRVKSFTVKTDTYTRVDDDGEEEVTQPRIGLITQSPITLWGALCSVDETRGPLSNLPLEIIRRGKDQNTRYDVFPFQDVDVDLSPIVDYLGGISYIRDELDDVTAAIDAADGDFLGAAQIVASAILDRRVEELADSERYEEIVGAITEPIESKFGRKKAPASPKASRPARPQRRSPREEVEGEAQPSKTEKWLELKRRVELGDQ